MGAIHKAKGVDWKETYLRASAKQSRLLTALSDRNWHPRTRLIIFRTFIRPLNEYTAVLAWIWAKKERKTRSDVLKLMEVSHQAAVKWIFNRRSHKKLLDYISGLGPWNHRLECLHAGLVFSLQKMNSSNPLAAARAFYMVSTSSHYLLPLCFKSEYSSLFLKSRTDCPKLTWHTWKSRQLEVLRQTASRSSATIAYYSPTLNSDRSSPIFLLDWKTFDIALNWRSNNMFLHRTCSCNHSFNRAHLSCFLNENDLYAITLASRSFKSSSLMVSNQFRGSCQLTVLDHLLNRSAHADFLTLLQELSSALDSLPSDVSDLNLTSLQTQSP